MLVENEIEKIDLRQHQQQLQAPSSAPPSDKDDLIVLLLDGCPRHVEETAKVNLAAMPCHAI